MKKIALIFIVFTLIISCKTDDNLSESCQLSTLISAEEYENGPSDNLTINKLDIKNNCLTISFSASGCDGNSWEYKLLDSENIDFLATTDETSSGQLAQRNLRLSLKNDEECEALIMKEVSFDISSLRVEGVNSVELNITNGITSITYEY